MSQVRDGIAVAVVPNCGHLTPLEVPEAAIRALVGLRDVNAEDTEFVALLDGWQY